MSGSTIQMGNDEFILYIRKNYPDCQPTNDRLGFFIADWLRNAAGDSFEQLENKPCLWGDVAPNILPQNATQFSFNRTVLPKLYDYLDDLGRKK